MSTSEWVTKSIRNCLNQNIEQTLVLSAQKVSEKIKRLLTSKDFVDNLNKTQKM